MGYSPQRCTRIGHDLTSKQNNSGQCETIPHSGFDFHFSNNWQWWSSFHVPVGHLYAFLREVYLILLPIFLVGLFVVFVLSCISSLHILEIKPASVANIFSHPPGCFLKFC